MYIYFQHHNIIVIIIGINARATDTPPHSGVLQQSGDTNNTSAQTGDISHVH